MTDPKITKAHEEELIKAHYAAIGRVAAEWAELEFMIDMSALRLAKIGLQNGACFTAQIAGSTRKFDAYVAIAKWRGASQTVKELHKLAKDIKGLSEQRNRIIHDSWSLTMKEPHRFEITARGKLKVEHVSEPTEKVNALADQIGALATRFLILNTTVRDEVDT